MIQREGLEISERLSNETTGKSWCFIVIRQRQRMNSVSDDGQVLFTEEIELSFADRLKVQTIVMPIHEQQLIESSIESSESMQEMKTIAEREHFNK
jgi:hypothetical protein